MILTLRDAATLPAKLFGACKMELTESQLYDMNPSSHSATKAAMNAEALCLSLMVKHLRFEHNMHLNDIAKRCGLKVNQVKTILGVE